MRQHLIIVVSVLLCISSSLCEQKRCRALVLAGGGDMGAYQAGVIRGLVKNLPNGEVQWDSVSGTSVGTLTALGVSNYKKGQEDQMTDYLLNLWQTTSASNVYKCWPGGILEGLFMRPGIFNTQPLRKFIQEQASHELYRMISITTTNANTGQTIVFHEDLPLADLQQAIMSSTAIPVIFPYQLYNDTVFIDGGVTMNVNVHSAIERCQEIGFKDTDIDVDIITMTPDQYIYQDIINLKSIGMIQRSQHLYSWVKTFDDIFFAKQDFPRVNFRYFVRPSKALPSSKLPLTFKKNDSDQMIKIGYQDALNEIKKGPGHSFNQFLQEIQQLKKILFK